METIMQQAQFTFSKSIADKSFYDSFNELIKRVNGVQADDLNLKPDMIEMFNNENAKERYPPVTGYGIKATPNFTMDMYILQNGSRIPLHDHSDMHGVLKVIHGTINVTSYSLIQNEIKIPHYIEDAMKTIPSKSYIPVKLHKSANIANTDNPSVLTPTEGNYHQISAVGGTAAIFDILAPPYGERQCHYYSVLETKHSECIWLVEEEEKPIFWCD